MRVVSHWNRLLREIVDSPTLVMFKAKMPKALSNLVLCELSLPMAWD